MNNLKKRIGFTIVELLIYIGLFSTVLLVTTEIFVSITDMYLETASTASLEQNTTFLGQKIQYDIFRSTQIREPVTPATPGNRLVLQINGADYIYEIQNGVMYITAEDETNAITTTGVEVTGMTVNRIGNGTATDSAKLEFSLRSRFTETGDRQRTKDYFVVATPR